MTRERWPEVKALVGRALETPPDERAALLDEACGEDETLRREVESLVLAAEQGDSLPGARDAVAAAARAFGQRRGGDADPELRALLESALGGQYDILLPLGRGGMGAVYLARERSLERFVAIKVLRPDLAAATESRERFRREARIAAQLVHPGILPLHTFGEVGGMWYFVMGYVRGESLAARLHREGALPHDEARRILAELADALACAHRHGVVHRDIKPANVLLDADTGRAILADFGISRLVDVDDDLTSTGELVGTPHFMSPEQAEGRSDVDGRSDVWSLGAVAYTMLAGREPFRIETLADVYERVDADPPPLAVVAPSVPPTLADVVMRCLARDPALRWQDAATLREAFVHADDAETSLPESVRGLPGFLPYATAWVVGWIALAARSPAGSVDHVLLLLIALIVPLGLAMHVWSTGRAGLSRVQVLRVACWPPHWWGMWWPRRLRRPGDLWPRLPRPGRAVRIALSAFIIGVPTIILARRSFGSDSADERRMVILLEGALLLVTAGVVAGSLLWARARRLTMGEAVHVLFASTMPSGGWRTPRVAALLRPDLSGVRAPDQHSAPDHARAVGELARLLAPSAGPAMEADAVRAARRLHDAIAALDREVASLARDASDAEIDRLALRLAALEDVGQAEVADRNELRALVERQLALVRRMQGRLEVARRERTRHFDLLRALWSQLCLVHDAATTAGGVDVDAVAAAATRVRALCAEVASAEAGTAERGAAERGAAERGAAEGGRVVAPPAVEPSPVDRTRGAPRSARA